MKILIIQTAFIGDVILATPLIEKLHRFYPDAQIDLLLRKGNETIVEGHPIIHRVLIWDKKESKYKNLVKLISLIRKSGYSHVINLHRFASSGLLTALSGAKEKIGFNKNPLSFFFTKTIAHEISTGKHEVSRNLDLIEPLTDKSFVPPKIYPSSKDWNTTAKYKTGKYVCIAPASIWFTKQFPKEKWIELIDSMDDAITIYLLGSNDDKPLCDEIIQKSQHKAMRNLSGELSLLQSAALMKDAQVNYVNDSAPMHFASAIDAPVIAVFCSTVPAFGFGPLSTKSYVVETKEKLDCRPCGLHGKKACPEGHFKCALTIKNEQLKQKGIFDEVF